MREYERRSRWTARHVLAVLLILGVLAAVLLLVYRLTDGGPTGSQPSQVAAGPTSTATTSAGVRPTATVPGTTDLVGPATLEPPDLEPVPEQPPEQRGPPTDDPPDLEPVPVPDLTADELMLEASLREDTRLSCEPRRTGLPAGAVAGVECHAYAEFVDRVGAYLFDSHVDSFRAYVDRLDRQGVELQSGSCGEGIPGDAAWEASDGVSNPPYSVPHGGGEYSIFREGCFLDEDGQANIRLTGLGSVEAGVYLGVVGRTDNIPQLLEWAWGGGGEAGPTIYGHSGPP